MTSRQAFCRSNEDHYYYRLLRLARISTKPTYNSYLEVEEKLLIADLNALVEKPCPAIRTILPLIYHKANYLGLSDLLDPGAQKLLRENTMRLIAAEVGFKQWLLKHIEIFEKERIPIICLKAQHFQEIFTPIMRLGWVPILIFL